MPREVRGEQDYSPDPRGIRMGKAGAGQAMRGNTVKATARPVKAGRILTQHTGLPPRAGVRPQAKPAGRGPAPARGPGRARPSKPVGRK